MGEYLNNQNGECVKIGTCEDLYYTRFNQLQGVIYAGLLTGSAEYPAENYLKPEYGWRYRFPFPDEDKITVGDYEPFERGYEVEVPMSFMDFDHGDKCVNMEGVNIFLPCIYSPKFKDSGLRTSYNYNQTRAKVEVIQQKQRNPDGTLGAAQLWTVIRCKCCGGAASIEPESIHILTDAITEQDKSKFGAEMVKRILKGYETPAHNVQVSDNGTIKAIADASPNIIIARIAPNEPKARKAKATPKRAKLAKSSSAPYGMKF